MIFALGSRMLSVRVRARPGGCIQTHSVLQASCSLWDAGAEPVVHSETQWHFVFSEQRCAQVLVGGACARVHAAGVMLATRLCVHAKLSFARLCATPASFITIACTRLHVPRAKPGHRLVRLV